MTTKKMRVHVSLANGKTCSTDLEVDQEKPFESFRAWFENGSVTISDASSLPSADKTLIIFTQHIALIQLQEIPE